MVVSPLSCPASWLLIFAIYLDCRHLRVRVESGIQCRQEVYALFDEARGASRAVRRHWSDRQLVTDLDDAAAASAAGDSDGGSGYGASGGGHGGSRARRRMSEKLMAALDDAGGGGGRGPRGQPSWPVRLAGLDRNLAGFCHGSLR